MSVLVGRVVVVEVDGWLINVWSTGAGCRRSSGGAGAVAVAGRTKSRRELLLLGLPTATAEAEACTGGWASAEELPVLCDRFKSPLKAALRPGILSKVVK